MHREVDVIIAELIKRKKFVFLCTNALLLLAQKLDEVQAVALLPLGGAHRRAARATRDESVCKEGVFDDAIVAMVKLAKSRARSSRWNTNTAFYNTDTPQTIIEVLTYLNAR